MSKQFVTKTKNGFDVFVDTETSHASTHLKDHPELLALMQEVISNYIATEEKVRFETDMGRIVGKMDLVETSDSDEIFYAKRQNRDKYTRFVKNREPEPTSFVTIELQKKSDTRYEVFTAFIGRLTPSFPVDKNDTNEENRKYWKNHALAIGNQEFMPETITMECPW